MNRPRPALRASRRARAAAAMAALLLGAAPPPARAQGPGIVTLSPEPPRTPPAASGLSEADLMDLMRAERFMMNGDAVRAEAMFRGLWDRGARVERVAAGLGSALLDLARWEDLEALALTPGVAAPVAARLQLLAGEGRARQGLFDRADEAWGRGVELAPAPARLGLMEEVAAMQLVNGLAESALRTVKAARELSRDDNALALHAAEARERTGDLPAAAEEYLRVLGAFPAQRSLAERRLVSLFESAPALRDTVAGGVAALVARQPGRTELRELLVNLYLDARRCPEALAQAVELERRAPAGGRFLLAFAEGASAGGCPEQAVAAFDSLRAGRPGRATAPAVELGLARLLERNGQTGPAADAYLRIARSGGNAPEARTAFARAAALLLELPGRAGEALEACDELERRYPGSREAREARARRTEAQLAAGRLQEAEASARAVLARDHTPEEEELARWQLGRVLFLDGRFEESQAELEAVVKTLTAGRAVNDCLELLTLLDLREEAGAGLGRFARAELLRLQGRRAEAAAELAALAATGGMLGGEAALRRAAVQREEGLAGAAAAGLDSLAAREKDAVLHARALKQLGDIAWEELRDGTRAREAYERLLVEHPDVYLADQVRRRLRQLPAALP